MSTFTRVQPSGTMIGQLEPSCHTRSDVGSPLPITHPLGSVSNSPATTLSDHQIKSLPLPITPPSPHRNLWRRQRLRKRSLVSCLLSFVSLPVIGARADICLSARLTAAHEGGITADMADRSLAESHLKKDQLASVERGDSDDGSSIVSDDQKQSGVQGIEAISQTWTRTSLNAAYLG